MNADFAFYHVLFEYGYLYTCILFVYIVSCLWQTAGQSSLSLINASKEVKHSPTPTGMVNLLVFVLHAFHLFVAYTRDVFNLSSKIIY